MSKKVSISISDSDFAELREKKHLVNVSKVCQDAIRKALKEVDDFRRWKGSGGVEPRSPGVPHPRS